MESTMPLEISAPPPLVPTETKGRELRMATQQDRRQIHQVRHEVYARELGQHAMRPEGMLQDSLDERNEYIVLAEGTHVLAFVSITPPGGTYSIDKYFQRSTLPFPCDPGLYEIRLLTVIDEHRNGPAASLLMYAAFRWVDCRGGTRIVAIGRVEVMDLYRKAGLAGHGQRVQSGEVTYELMSATLDHARRWAPQYQPVVDRLLRGVKWQLPCAVRGNPACFHGGSFFEAIGEDFQTLEKRHQIINADVLDAWFPPAPGVSSALTGHLDWLARTSPPLDAAGLRREISRVRAIPEDKILTGAGSSSLIFLAFREWLRPDSTVVLPDPTYGEYAHVLEHVIGCRVVRLPLSFDEGFRIKTDDMARLASDKQARLVVLVNPNNPTGRLMPLHEIRRLASALPSTCRLWLDEAYVDYAGKGHSAECLLEEFPNLYVCKSMSKVYALSGMRVAYLAGERDEIARLRRLQPPWSVALPSQVAAVEALREESYYRARYEETCHLREALESQIRMQAPGFIVLGSQANFILGRLPQAGPDAATVVERCQREGVYLRGFGSFSRQLDPWVIRIAVKDEANSSMIVRALARAAAQA
jgi:histidinol-phosphate/aromatic aminotransferase/cobyric acid decarboxylase-like protein/N-acyl-L-homoserine lactone synthetase